MARDAEAQAVAASCQPLGLDVEIGSGQQELGRGLVGVEPQRRLERVDGLGPLTRCELLAADQEVVQGGDGRLLAASSSSRCRPAASPSLARQSARRRW